MCVLLCARRFEDMQTRKLSRISEKLATDDLSTHTPVKKRRKLSLSLKKEKLKSHSDDGVLLANSKEVQSTASVDLTSNSPRELKLSSTSLKPAVEFGVITNSDQSSSELMSELEPAVEESTAHSKQSNAELTSPPTPDTGALQPMQTEVVHSDGYYLFNFKFILDIVITSSPERHVITQESSTVVGRFKSLSRM